MTVPSLITAELLLAGILLSLYLHSLQRSQFLKLLQAWLNSIRGKQHRHLQPNTPQECPLCAAHSTPVKQAKAAVRIRAWTEQKGVQGRKKRKCQISERGLKKRLSMGYANAPSRRKLNRCTVPIVRQATRRNTRKRRA